MRSHACVLLSLAATLAFGQEKQTPPEGGPPRPFHLPQTQELTLAERHEDHACSVWRGSASGRTRIC